MLDLLKRYKTIVFLIIIALVSFIWGLRLDCEWGCDFGCYYVGAKLLASDYHLYLDHLDHKGPLIYLLLKIVGTFIGWGAFQAILSLSLFVFGFLTTVFFFGMKVFKSFISSVYLVVVAYLMIIWLNTNSSITLLQMTFIIWMLAFLIPVERDDRQLYSSLFLAGMFWTASVLVRIDAAIYIVLFPISVMLANKRSVARLFISLLVPVFTLAVFSVVLSVAMSYPLYDFIIWAWEFNFKYGNVQFDGKRMFLRPYALPLLIQTVAVLVLSCVILKPGYGRKKINLNANYFFVAATVVSCLAYFIARTDNYYYVFMLFPAVLSLSVVIVDNAERRKGMALLLVLLSLFAFYGSSLYVREFFGSIKQNTAFSMKDVRDMEVVEMLKSDPAILVCYTRPWYYLFSDSYPLVYIEPHLLLNQVFNVFPEKTAYAREKFSVTAFKSRTKFIIDKWTKENPTELTLQMLLFSDSVRLIGDLELRQMR